MALDGQRFCLKWSDFRNSVTTVFEDLRKDGELVDITLCCEGRKVKAHRMMLSACSPYFRDLLKDNPCQHPVFFLPKDTSYTDLKAVVEFMYNGEVNVTQGQLSSFLKTAEMLQIRGLTGDEDKEKETAAPPPPPPPPAMQPRRPQPPPAPVLQQPRHVLPHSPLTRRSPVSPRVHPQFMQQHRQHPSSLQQQQQQSVLQRRPVPMQMPAAAPPQAAGPPRSPEVVSVVDSPPSSPAAKRRRHSGSSGGGEPSTSQTSEQSADSAAPSPAGTAEGAAPPPPATSAPATTAPPGGEGPPASEESAGLPSASPAPVPAPTPATPAAPAPPPSASSESQPDSGNIKVEKIDVMDDDESLQAALGEVAGYEGSYEGSYESDQSLGGYPGGDPTQGGSGMMPGTSDGANPGSLVPLPTSRMNEKPKSWFCDHCGKGFARKNAVYSHLQLHAGETQCSFCLKHFSTKGNLKVHMKMFHGQHL